MRQRACLLAIELQLLLAAIDGELEGMGTFAHLRGAGFGLGELDAQTTEQFEKEKLTQLVGK